MENPSLYQRSNAVQRQDALEVLDQFSSKLRWGTSGGDTVLDIGCGSGDVLVDLLLPRMPANVGKVVGSDLCEKMIEHAKMKYGDQKLQFEVMDISSDLSYRNINETFHHVTSFYCLNWVQNQRQAATNIYNLLKPDGDCLLLLMGTGAIYEIYELMSRIPKWSSYTKDYAQFLPPQQRSENIESEYLEIMKSAGFENVHCEIRKKVFTFKNWSVYRNAIEAVNPFMSRIPTYLHAEYFEDFFYFIKKLNLVIRDDTCNHTNEKDMQMIFPYTYIVVYAVK